MIPVVVGIDPGVSGAICRIQYPEDEPEVFSIWDMPVFEKIQNKKKRRVMDPRSLSTIINVIAHTSISNQILVCIEDPHAMPGQGVSSSFSFGFSCGVVRGVVATVGLRYVLVDPSVWKKNLCVPSDKDGARRRASELMPNASGLWPARSHDGRAEAALLAFYAKQKDWIDGQNRC